MVLLVVVVTEMVAGMGVGTCAVALQFLSFVAVFASPEKMTDLRELKGGCGDDGTMRGGRS